jgi:hypothetical protein
MRFLLAHRARAVLRGVLQARLEALARLHPRHGSGAATKGSPLRRLVSGVETRTESIAEVLQRAPSLVVVVVAATGLAKRLHGKGGGERVADAEAAPLMLRKPRTAFTFAKLKLLN